MKKNFFLFIVTGVLFFVLSCNQSGDKSKIKEKLNESDTPIEKYCELIKIEIPKNGIPLRMGILDEKFEKVTESFQIAKYEVTFSLWRKVTSEMSKKGYSFFSNGRAGGSNAETELTEENKYKPVSYISWLDAVVWCNAYSEYSGLKPVYTYNKSVLKNSKEAVEKFKKREFDLNAVTVEDTDGYRLPFETEWEFTARFIGKSKPDSLNIIETEQDSVKYYFTKGNAMSGCFSEAADSEESGSYAWFMYNSDNKTHIVGSKKPNFLNCFDMSGNISEWCFDGSDMNRLNKGGAYNMQGSGRDYMKTGFNLFQDLPDICMDFFGLRVAKSVK